MGNLMWFGKPGESLFHQTEIRFPIGKLVSLDPAAMGYAPPDADDPAPTAWDAAFRLSG